jgi:hypothetical protein
MQETFEQRYPETIQHAEADSRVLGRRKRAMEAARSGSKDRKRRRYEEST